MLPPLLHISINHVSLHPNFQNSSIQSSYSSCFDPTRKSIITDISRGHLPAIDNHLCFVAGPKGILRELLSNRVGVGVSFIVPGSTLSEAYHPFFSSRTGISSLHFHLNPFASKIELSGCFSEYQDYCHQTWKSGPSYSFGSWVGLGSFSFCTWS